MDFFHQLDRTENGRPKLIPNELEIYSQADINLYDGQEKTKHRYGRCVLTTHRILWIRDACESGEYMFLPLDYVRHITKESGFLSRSGKIVVHLKKVNDAPSNTEKTGVVKFSFKEGGRDNFYNPLQNSLNRQVWKNDSKPSMISDKRLEDKREFCTSNAGIAGILRKKEKEMNESTTLASQAFSDLNVLMEKAKDVVALIERYVETTQDQASETSKVDSTGQETKLNELNSLMHDMGIVNPVTKQNAGAAYHQELARQLAEFLKNSMQKYGGIMSLSDIFCLFNRARGSELISPDDLYQAALMQKRLGLGLHMRSFEGGLIVLQSDAHSESKVVQKLQKMVKISFKGYITSLEVSTEMKISVPLAREYLMTAETAEILCRDDTIEGLNFYSNQFLEFEKKLIE